jgi:Alpha galactosidase A/Alpha galactosidase C-terminal beta sandwich domain
MRERIRRIVRQVIQVMLIVGIFGSCNLRSQTVKGLVAIPLPPMGWSSWNSFSNTVDSQIVMDQARAMISSGMHKAGYQYINIDEGWWLGARDAQGNIVVDAAAWPALAAGERPGDMANIVRFIHGLGLRAGIYTDAGKDGCSMYPDLGPKYFHTGSEGHYEQDFLQFAKWGFDYVKVDWCGGDKENLDPAVQYAEIARAIARAEAITGRRLYFSLCEWGKNSPWTWAPNVGGSPADIWRTSGDIVAPIVAGHEHADRKASFEAMLSNFDQGVHPEAEHSGYYNDPDMMVLGMPGLTDEQNRVHMALWAMSGAPLLVGADLTSLSPETLATLTNERVLAVDQDAAGLQAVKIAEPQQGLQVWSKALAAPGSRAVLLLNRTAAEQPITVTWASLGLDNSATRIADAWTGKQLEAAKDSFTTTVGAKDGVLLLITGREGPMKLYHPSLANGAADIGVSQSAPQQRTVRFDYVQGRGAVARILITYANPDSGPRYAELRVNGDAATRIAFPSTGKSGAGRLWIQSVLAGNGTENVLVFSEVCAPGPIIQSISVQ